MIGGERGAVLFQELLEASNEFSASFDATLDGGVSAGQCLHERSQFGRVNWRARQRRVRVGELAMLCVGGCDYASRAGFGFGQGSLGFADRLEL